MVKHETVSEKAGARRSIQGIGIFVAPEGLTVKLLPLPPLDSSDQQATFAEVGTKEVDFIAVLIARPPRHYLQGEFFDAVHLQSLQGTSLALSGPGMVPAFARFRIQASVTVLARVGIAAFAS